MKFRVLRKRSVLEQVTVDVHRREDARAAAQKIPVKDWHTVDRDVEWEVWPCTNEEDEFDVPPNEAQ